MSKWVLLIGLAVVLLGGGGAWFAVHQEAPATQFRTVAVARRDVAATVAASGTLEPEEVADVGARVNGQILGFGPDKDAPGRSIDRQSNVTAGQVLAKIDDRPYQFTLEKARAEVDSSKAAIVKAQADLEQMHAKLFQATADWNRVNGPAAKSAGISDQERDQYQSAQMVAQANVDDAKAAIEQAKTTLAEDDAALRQAQQDVDYCTIYSPVTGSVIARRMNAGDMVNTSMSAASLFLIAKDLRRMQVWAAVNEADVVRIHPGQPVTFAVDAWPGQTFHGVVIKGRNDAQMNQNVVTYPVEIAVDNTDGRLRPYMTANVQFVLDPRTHVQTVPNAALRWMPRDDQLAPGSDTDRAAPPPPPSAPSATQPTADADELRDRGTVWLDAGNGLVRPVRVRVGVSDGVISEVAGVDPDDLPDGSAVIVGEVDPTAEATAGGTSNPFVPQFGKRKK